MQIGFESPVFFNFIFSFTTILQQALYGTLIHPEYYAVFYTMPVQHGLTRKTRSVCREIHIQKMYMYINLHLGFNFILQILYLSVFTVKMFQVLQSFMSNRP
jgi:hypothetical protein